MQLTRTYLYTSCVQGDFDPKRFSSMINDARNFNSTHNISGVLFFDGTQFLQYIEGPNDAMEQAISRIAQSSTHYAIETLFDYELPLAERNFNDWDLAYIHDPEIAESVRNAMSLTYNNHEALLRELNQLLELSDLLE